MTDKNRYVGQVVHTKENFGFIGLSTVRKLDGSPVKLSAKKDIFVHTCDFSGDLRVGMELTFELQNDWERKGEFRANDVLLSGIKLQFLEQVVDHPVIPVSWCVMPEAIELMRSLAADDYYVVIAARERGTQDEPWRGDRKKTTFETIIGLDRIKDSRGYLSFFAPGTYDVFTYLVQSEVSRERLVKTLSELDMERFDPVDARRGTATQEVSDLPFLKYNKFDRLGRVIGINHLTLEVPDGIFAKPLTGLMKRWFCYFWSEDLLDDCDRRKKLWFAFTIGVPMYFLWEGLKRLWMIVLSLGHLIVGGNPTTLLKRATTGRLSSTISNIFGKYEYVDMMEFTGGKFFLRPIFSLLLAAFVVANFQSPELWEGTAKVLMSAAAVLTIVLVLCGGYLFLTRNDTRTPEEVAADRKEAKERRIESMKKERLDSLLGEVAVYATCGTTTQSRPASVRLIWSGIKRKVCRNYRKV
jgi:hypothetical protein